MKTRIGRSPFRRAAAFSFPEHQGDRAGDDGFALVEVLICALILTVGMLAIAALLGVTTQMQIGARESARSTRLAQDKIDELMRMDLDSDPEVAVGGDLDTDVANHSETLAGALSGVTIRWLVAAGPTDDTRVLTVRVVNLRAQQYRQTNLATIIRE